jgi:hypothetical protein
VEGYCYVSGLIIPNQPITLHHDFTTPITWPWATSKPRRKLTKQSAHRSLLRS